MKQILKTSKEKENVTDNTLVCGIRLEDAKHIAMHDVTRKDFFKIL